MSERQLTVEQLAAVAADHQHYAVRAGAGTGKTSVIVATFVKLVEQGLRVEEILTLTFSRRAAADMKSRIVAELRSIGKTEDAQIAETGPIQTIDSYCDRTLREYAVAAGVDPDFEILAESSAKTLIHEILIQTLADLATEDPQFVEIANRIGTTGLRRGGAFEETLLDELQKVLSDMRSSFLNRSEYEEVYSSYEKFSRICQRDLLSESIGNSKQSEGSVDSVFGPNWEWTDVCSRLSQASSEFARAKWANNRSIELLEQSWHESWLMGRISIAAWRALDHALFDAQQFDFNYIARRVALLFESSKEAQKRVQRTVKHLLVDEAQDVSPLQYRLFDAMGIERSVYVGDPQQSIYIFRHADVELFKSRLGGLAKFELTTNFRSHEGILNFVQAVFAEHWQADYQSLEPQTKTESKDPFGDPLSFENVQMWQSPIRWPDAVAQGIRSLCEGGVSLGNVVVLCRKNREIESVSAALEEQGISHRVSGGLNLFYSRMSVRDLAVALEALVDPRNAYAVLCLLHGPMVGLGFDSIAELALGGEVFEQLHDFEPSDEADKPKIEEFRDWFFRLSATVDRGSAFEAISQLMNESPLIKSIASQPNALQNLANIRKLLQIAAKSPSESPTSFAKLIRGIQELRHDEGEAETHDANAEVVTIMTIHKAKGLEFPIVILPITEYSYNRGGSTKFDKKQGIVAAKCGLEESAYYSLLKDREKRQNESEFERLMYVAMTRSKEKLCLVVDPGRKENRLVRRIINTAGSRENPAPGIYYLDILESVD